MVAVQGLAIRLELGERCGSERPSEGGRRRPVSTSLTPGRCGLFPQSLGGEEAARLWIPRESSAER